MKLWFCFLIFFADELNVSGFDQLVKICAFVFVLFDDENVHGFFQISHEFGCLQRKNE